MNKPSADRIIRTLVEILEARNNVKIKYAVKEVEVWEQERKT